MRREWDNVPFPWGSRLTKILLLLPSLSSAPASHIFLFYSKLQASCCFTPVHLACISIWTFLHNHRPLSHLIKWTTVSRYLVSSPYSDPPFLLVYPASSSWDADEVYTLLLAAVPFLLGQFKSSTSPAPHFVTAFTLLKDSISCFAEHLAFGLGSCLLMGSFKLCLSSHISLK